MSKAKWLATLAIVLPTFAVGQSANPAFPVGPLTGTTTYPQVVPAKSRIHLFFIYDSRPSTRAQVFVASSSDKGLTFSNATQIAETENPASQLTCANASKSDNSICAWSETDLLLQTARIRFVRATDGGTGKTFSAPGAIADSGIATSPSISTDLDDNCYLIWESGEASVLQRQIRFARSVDQGRTFTSLQTLSPSGPFSAPSILWADGRLHAFWRNTTSGQGAVTYRQSSDGGITWSSPETVSGTTTTSLPLGDVISPFRTGQQSIGFVLHDATRDSDRLLYFQRNAGATSFASPVTVSALDNADPQVRGSLSPALGSAIARVGAFWVGRKPQTDGAVPYVFGSCSSDSSRFDSGVPVLQLSGAVNFLSVAPDANGVFHGATVQTLDSDSKLLYFQARCPPLFTAPGVVSSADGVGTLSPGLLTSIYGFDIGPDPGANGTIDSAAFAVTTTASGVQVLVNDRPVPVLYVRRDQLNFQAPYELAGQTSARLAVSVNGVVSSEITVPVTPVRPALFTLNGSGTGPVVAQNQDLTINQLQGGAAPGSVVTLYGTGQGVVSPSLATGRLGPLAAPFPEPPGGIQVLLDGQTITPLFGAIAPALLGAVQINFRIPVGTPSGARDLRIRVGGQTSRTGTTITVR